MKPLNGVKVIDFSQGHDASAGTMIMSDYGAEVIKIENVKGGDIARTWEPIKNGKSSYFTLLNRGKKGIAIDLETPEGKEIINKLVKEADVVVENFKTGTMDALGLGYEDLKKVNPKIIYGVVTGFGTTGPMKYYPNTEFTTYAYGGFLQITGDPDDTPSVAGYPIMSYFAAQFLLSSVTVALIARKVTGRGQMIDLSMADISLSVFEDRFVSYEFEKFDSVRVGNAHPTVTPYDTLPCKDGYVNISPSTDKMWEEFCDELGFPEVAFDPKYNPLEVRADAYFKGGLKEMIIDAFADCTKQDISDRLNARGIPTAPVYSIIESIESEQIAVSGMRTEIDDPVIGKFEVPNVAGKLSKTPGKVEGTSPEIGENTEEILSSIGYSEDEIAELRSKKVI